MKAALLSSGRGRTLLSAGLALLVLLAIAGVAPLLPESGLRSDLTARALPPGWLHPFGTDLLGRDMLVRTIKGLAISLTIGLFSAGLAALLAVLLGVLAALDRRCDIAIGALLDITLALPHLVLLILLSFTFGGGTHGVILAVILSHWPGLARLMRAEMRSLLTADYVQLARRLGRSKWDIARHHIAPQLLPQALVGAILLFPHAILHEAGMSFLGFGLEPHTPAIGILLAESLRSLTAGLWWLGALPGLCLLIMVMMFDRVAAGVRLALDPRRAQE